MHFFSREELQLSTKKPLKKSGKFARKWQTTLFTIDESSKVVNQQVSSCVMP